MKLSKGNFSPTYGDITMGNSKSAKEVLLQFYDAERIYMAAGGKEANADVTGMSALIDPTFVLYQTPDLPYGGDYHGVEGFVNWAIAMSSYFDVVDVRDPVIIEGEGGVVVVTSTLRTRSRKSGEEMLKPMCQVMKIKDGKLVEIRPYYWNVPDYVKLAKGEKVAGN